MIVSRRDGKWYRYCTTSTMRRGFYDKRGFLNGSSLRLGASLARLDGAEICWQGEGWRQSEGEGWRQSESEGCWQCEDDGGPTSKTVDDRRRRKLTDVEIVQLAFGTTTIWSNNKVRKNMLMQFGKVGHDLKVVCVLGGRRRPWAQKALCSMEPSVP